MRRGHLFGIYWLNCAMIVAGVVGNIFMTILERIKRCS